MKAALPADEAERLDTLHSCKILDTDPEPEFEDITLLASRICGTPIALISLLDEHRQWFKATVGLAIRETPRDISFCAHTILQQGVLVVPDTLSDERFASNPFVTDNPRIRFYAGAPLIMKDGHALGTLCVLDQAPSKLNAWQTTALQALSRQVVGQIEWRRTIIQLTRADELLREQMGMVAMETEVRAAFADGETVPDMLKAACSSIVNHLGAAFARIWILNERDQMLELRASAGQYTHLDGPHGRVPVGKFKIGLIAQERKPHLTNQVVGDPRVGDQEWAKAQGMVAFAGYPLIVGGRLVGVVAMFARHILTNTVLTSLDAVANSIASGINRRGSEAAIRASEERFRLLAKATSDTIWDWDLVTDALWWNEGIENVFGYPRDGLAPTIKSWTDLIHPEDMERVTEGIHHAIEGGAERWMDEYRLRHIDGSYVHVLDRGHIIHDASGRAIRMIGGLTDQTERIRNNERLLILSSAAEQAKESLLITNAELDPPGPKIISVNPAFTIMTGYTAEEAIGMTPRILQGPLTDRAFLKRLRKSLEHGEAFEGEAINYRKDGTEYNVEWSIAPLRNARGEITHFVSVQREITSRKRSEAALRESELRYHSLFENMLEGYAYCQTVFEGDRLRDFTYLETNGAFERLTGLKDVVGKKISDIFPGVQESDPELFNIYGRVALTGKPEKCEVYLKALCIWLSIAVYSHKKEHFIAVFDNITERKLAEAKLRERQTALALAQSVAHLGSWEMDLLNLDNVNANPLRWSDETYRIFGYLPDEISVSNDAFFSSVHPMDRENVIAGFAEMLRTGHTYSLDHRIILPSGAERVVHEEAMMISDGDNTRPGKVVGTVQDITDRRAGEERLLEQAGLLELAHDVIMVRDLDDQIRFWNRAGETVYGWTSLEAIGNRAGELLQSNPEAHALAIKCLMESGEWSGELRQTRKDGKPVIVASRWTLLRNSQGHPKAVLVISSDITEHKKLESQFLRAQRLESVGTLASGVAHDLNNVLSPILMAAPLLREKIDTGLRDQLISNIEVSAQRAADIVRQVLTFARGVEGDRLLVQPTHLIKEIVQIAQDTFPKSIQVFAKYPPDQWAIEADPTQVHQILLNLCVNARDAMPDGGEIMISLENLMIDEQMATMMPGARPGAYVVIKVSDTGTGIPPEIIDQIFDPFFTTKEVGKGTGLGLSTTIGIVKSHGGFINVYSEVGAGTTFNVFLPAAGDAEERIKEDIEEYAPPGNGELLLVVDDERPICEMAEMILERHGYRVVMAGDGTEALAIFAHQFGEIKAVITDLMMPFMDGITLIRTLRKIKPEIAIIASSGRSDDKRMKELRTLDVPTCLIKPYTRIKLLTAVHDLLAGRAK